MDMQIGLIIGIGIVMFVLLYIAFKIESKDRLELFAIQLFLIAFALILGLLIPQTFLEPACYPVVNETTEVTEGNYQYNYNLFCEDIDTDTPTTFYKIYTFMLRMGGFALFLILNWILWFRLICKKLGLFKLK